MHMFREISKKKKFVLSCCMFCAAGNFFLNSVFLFFRAPLIIKCSKKTVSTSAPPLMIPDRGSWCPSERGQIGLLLLLSLLLPLPPLPLPPPLLQPTTNRRPNAAATSWGRRGNMSIFLSSLGFWERGSPGGREKGNRPCLLRIPERVGFRPMARLSEAALSSSVPLRPLGPGAESRPPGGTVLTRIKRGDGDARRILG